MPRGFFAFLICLEDDVPNAFLGSGHRRPAKERKAAPLAVDEY